MKLARLEQQPSALIDFFQEGLEALGAVCERTWHDRLQLVAEGPAAHLWHPDGRLLESEIHFVPPEDSAPRQADREVFPGCPLTFRLAEELRPNPVAVERAILSPSEPARAPTPEVAEKLWYAQIAGSSRWKIQGTLFAGWHLSVVAAVRCEIQAIDQHWSLHRLAVSLPDGQPDDALAASLEYAQLSTTAAQLQWPSNALDGWQEHIRQALAQDLQSELSSIRQRQARYLARELERIDAYFQSYETELLGRQSRSRADSSKLKIDERLAAAKTEHARRRQDQIHRHEIRVILHLDSLLLVAEPAWEGKVSFLQKGESRLASAMYVPRSRKWLLAEQGNLERTRAS